MSSSVKSAANKRMLAGCFSVALQTSRKCERFSWTKNEHIAPNYNSLFNSF